MSSSSEQNLPIMQLKSHEIPDTDLTPLIRQKGQGKAKLVKKGLKRKFKAPKPWPASARPS